MHTAAPGVPHCGNCSKPLPWMAEAGEHNFAAVVEQSPVPALVDFWAPGAVPAAWWSPSSIRCRAISPAG